jgi:hypothetical protein
VQLEPNDLGLAVTLGLALLSLRLFRLAARTRRLPELLVAIYFLAAPIGISLSIRIPRFAPEHAELLRAAVAGLYTVGGVALMLFAWCVFHPHALWAKALAWGGSLAISAVWAVELAAGIYATDSSFWTRLPTFSSYLWVFLESLRYHRMLRRRERLGLVDPVVANRFLLFAIWTGSVVAITFLGAVAGIAAEWSQGGFREEDSFGSPAVLAVTRLIALPMGVAIWLTFLAPAGYHDWLRRRAAIRREAAPA